MPGEERFYCEIGRKVDALLERCKRCQGEFIPAGHGAGSWATTYSHEFIAAATELYELFHHSMLGLPEFMLSQAFRSADVQTVSLLKFMPLAFMLTWDADESFNFPYPNLIDFMGTKEGEFVDIPLDFKIIPAPRYPEMPGKDGVALHGRDSYAASRHKSS